LVVFPQTNLVDLRANIVMQSSEVRRASRAKWRACPQRSRRRFHVLLRRHGPLKNLLPRIGLPGPVPFLRIHSSALLRYTYQRVQRGKVLSALHFQHQQ
jgi:hypothetical protein